METVNSNAGNNGLRKGFSTGSVSAAAIKASIKYYFKHQKFFRIEIKMPGGENVLLPVAELSKIPPLIPPKVGGIRGRWVSRASVIKDSGDDPDVTNGIKICADFMFLDDADSAVAMLLNEADDIKGNQNQDNQGGQVNRSKNTLMFLHLYEKAGETILTRLPDEVKKYYGKLYIYNIIKHSGFSIILSSSAGIGIVRRQGLPVSPGFPAINPVPFKMIEWAVKEEINGRINDRAGNSAGINQNKLNGIPCNGVLLSILYVPDGGIVAKKTLNPRLGIEGGISILGTTGYVIPISAKAWLGTIKSSLAFLSGNKIDACVYTPGRFSEKTAMKILKDMPKESFIEIGDYVSYSIRKAAGSGIKRVIFAGQFGKIVKISQGARNTNAKYGNLDLKYLGALVKAVLKEHIDIMQEDMAVDLYEKIINSNTSRQAYDYILSLRNVYNPLPDKIFYNILKAAKENLIRMSRGQVNIDIILISYEGKMLAST
ncbi:MAG: cobalt-precorrin-5B (C(1))-methyltransferase [Deltaproteobacteria bacterium]|nr:cobalt-precorrin-5B (C(1))-methyltransferase [Deltaproteobacteria bacterium]